MFFGESEVDNIQHLISPSNFIRS